MAYDHGGGSGKFNHRSGRRSPLTKQKPPSKKESSWFLSGGWMTVLGAGTALVSIVFILAHTVFGVPLPLIR